MTRRARALPSLLGVFLVACAGAGPETDSGLPSLTPSRSAGRVVLISVAGLQPAHYGVENGSLGEAGLVMPNLAALARRGAYAEAVDVVLPAAPYPVHATLVTGRRPDRHQVLGDELLGRQGVDVRGIARESRIRGVPLWRAAQARGLKVTALNWPSTQGSDIDLLLPDMGVPSGAPEQRWFEDLRERATPWVVERVRRLDARISDLRWPSPELRDSLAEQMACEIARQPVTPSLWLLTFEQSGATLARHGPGSEGGETGLTRVDDAIGRLLECFDDAGLLDTTAFVVVGDRTLFPLHTVVYPNIVLENVGLITPTTLRTSGVARWLAYVRSHGGAAAVYADREADALLARRALEEQATRTRAFRIVPAAEMAQLHGDPGAWFGLQGEDGYGIGKSARGVLLQATERRGLGGYLPSRAGSEVGFVAAGAGMRAGVRVPRLSQIDVAPTVARLLGFELSGADGRPLVGILQP